ncbi:MAG: hypothetical protein F6K04_18710, partial [Leptolyngbya sp. SIO4C5]|nr:hypothetical protein [Leptolyngbya sp. SIO4C5]
SRSVEVASSTDLDASLENALLDDGLDLQDVVLDDQTARSYKLDPGMDGLSEDGQRRSPNGYSALLDDGDGLIDDQTELG